MPVCLYVVVCIVYSMYVNVLYGAGRVCIPMLYNGVPILCIVYLCYLLGSVIKIWGGLDEGVSADCMPLYKKYHLSLDQFIEF